MFNKCPYCYDSYRTSVGCSCPKGREHFITFSLLTTRLDMIASDRVNHKIPQYNKKMWNKLIMEAKNV